GQEGAGRLECAERPLMGRSAAQVAVQREPHAALGAHAEVRGPVVLDEARGSQAAGTEPAVEPVARPAWQRRRLGEQGQLLRENRRPSLGDAIPPAQLALQKEARRYAVPSNAELAALVRRPAV